ncbi:hypothetical protein GJ496_007525 [Pomphorhynchus laevis]|nr:hypothetical protein GJ496_007525 [Pomphorhynchus laevis]
MGTWRLEVFKMVLYVSFPLAFYGMVSNPDKYEEQVKELKRRRIPANMSEEIEQMKQLLRKRDQESLLKKEAKFSARDKQ